MLSKVNRIWEKSIQVNPRVFIEDYAYTLSSVKEKLNINNKLLECFSNSNYIPTYVIKSLFESYLEEDDYAYYLSIPSYLITEEKKNNNDRSIPILQFKEIYEDENESLSFKLLEGSISEGIIEVAVLKESVLSSFSNQISKIIRTTSENRIKFGTEWARARLVEVVFSKDPNQLTYRWRTEPTEHERTTVEVGDKELPVTSTRNVARGAVDTVPDISHSSYVGSPSGKGRTVNFKKDTAYTMELQFTADKQWKKTPYVKINKAQIENMIDFGKVRFFCSCPHFNWGGVAYNLTLDDASIQPQNVPDDWWIQRHGRPHKLCKHLRNLLKGFKIWENKMVSITRKTALEKSIDY